jgi:beta-lactamase superfamily II metal-dependent hydrolase
VEIRIFDVEHGFCAYIIADNKNVILIDCGYNSKTGFRPSSYLLHDRKCNAIERFIVSNYDEDHLDDLPQLRQNLPIITLQRNRSIDADTLQRIKLRAGPLQPGIKSMLDMIRTYNSDVINPPEFPQIEIVTFNNRYPEFEDTNNLSLVTFLHYRNIHIIFPGDLEKAGWEKLLEQSTFRDNLRKINFFVASHHGREGGYYEEVFDYCKPEIIIISDEQKQYDTQETAYRQHASGILFAWTRRYVLTTRKDGMITISQIPGEGPKINTAK